MKKDLVQIIRDNPGCVATIDDKRIIEISRETLDRGLCFAIKSGRKLPPTRITYALDSELIDFAHQLFTAQVEAAAERVGVHVEASRKLALISSAVRAGASDEVLGRAVRSIVTGE